MFQLAAWSSICALILAPVDAHSAYAQEIRKKLAETTDTELLLAAAEYLAAGPSSRLDFDTRALAASYVDRVLQLDPASPHARGMKVRWMVADRRQRLRAVPKDLPKDKQYDVVSAIPEADRFAWLPWLGGEVHARGDESPAV